MPVTIGGKPESGFDDPIGLLGDCHRRVERFLSVLLRIASELRGGPLTEAQRTSLTTALRYFREAAPKHTADEEESLFPRLRNLPGPEGQAILKQLENLESDHVNAGKVHADVDRLGLEWLKQGTLPREEADQLIRQMEALSSLYQRHIAIEEGEIFPFAAVHVSVADKTEVGTEMAARRGLVNGSAELFRDGGASF